MNLNRYFQNYIIVACILSVFFSVCFYFTDIVQGMFFSAFWGTFTAFALVLSVWCDKYVNSKK